MYPGAVWHRVLSNKWRQYLTLHKIQRKTYILFIYSSSAMTKPWGLLSVTPLDGTNMLQWLAHCFRERFPASFRCLKTALLSQGFSHRKHLLYNIQYQSDCGQLIPCLSSPSKADQHQLRPFAFNGTHLQTTKVTEDGREAASHDLLRRSLQRYTTTKSHLCAEAHQKHIQSITVVLFEATKP